MGKPVIGLTTGRVTRFAPEKEVPAVTIGCDIEYVDAVTRAGGAPLLLPRGMDVDALQAAMPLLDGLLLTGGGDVHSLAYGQEPHPRTKLQDPVRDAMELAIIRRALARHLPILAICRGLQLLNVALGGTLIQDIPDQVPGAVKHYNQSAEVLLLHSVEIEADALLARVLGSTSLAVNSWHHQAIDTLGAGLRVTARARDGVIEAVESTDQRPLLAVQFHPEECGAHYPIFARLFDWLVEESRHVRVGVG